MLNGHDDTVVYLGPDLAWYPGGYGAWDEWWEWWWCFEEGGAGPWDDGEHDDLWLWDWMLK
jgi:hypothetical protein